MTGQLTHARSDPLLRPRIDEEDACDSDDEDDEQAEAADDETFEHGFEFEESERDEDGAQADSEPAPRARRRRVGAGRARGAGGMGRPSTGPAPRAAATPGRVASVSAPAAEVDAELAPDISSWPGTTEAARQVGRHTSTIKLWRAQGRIRAVQDATGCWRHHPDDLAEAIDTPDQTDPGSVLASGMTAIVQQGASASERLLRMTEIATDGLKDASGVLSKELERAYARIAELEVKLAELRDKNAVTHEADLKHERFIRRLGMKHELELAGAVETSKRLDGLLSILGPIAASIGARMLGKEFEALRADAVAAGTGAGPGPEGSAPRPNPQPPAPDPAPPSTAGSGPASDDHLVALKIRITDLMSRLCHTLRVLPDPAFQGLRAMLPPAVQEALDDVRNGTSDSAVGAALATIVRVAQNLSDLQFMALRPIVPADVAAIMAELRTLLRNDSPAPESPPSS